MSPALSETGKTRLPRSVLSGTPSPSKKALVSAGMKRVSAPYRKRPLVGTFAMNSPISGQSLVRLQRPLPVIESLRPQTGFFSNSVTRAPACAAAPAAIIPAAPPPITATCLISLSAKLSLPCPAILNTFGAYVKGRNAAPLSEINFQKNLDIPRKTW